MNFKKEQFLHHPVCPLFLHDFSLIDFLVETIKLHVVSSLDKLMALPGGCLLVDTGDQQLDDALAGFIQIIVSDSRTVVFPIKSPGSESLS